MRIDNDLLYMECPCGSGKRFKFCHWPLAREKLGLMAAKGGGEAEKKQVRDVVLQLLKPRGKALDAEAVGGPEELAAMKAAWAPHAGGDWKAARARYRALREAHPEYWPAWNAEALMLWMDGDAEGAVAAQRAALEGPGGENATGWAQLSEWLYVLDRDEESRACVERARRLPAVSEEGTLAVCRALAHWRMHAELAEYAMGSGCDGEPEVASLTGVALGCLGRREEAMPYLQIADGARGPGADVASYVLGVFGGDSPEDEDEEDAQGMEKFAYFGLANYAIGPEWVRQAFHGGRNVTCDVTEMLMDQNELNPDEAAEILKKVAGERAAQLRKTALAMFAAYKAVPVEKQSDDFAWRDLLIEEHHGLRGQELLGWVLQKFGYQDTVLHGESTAAEAGLSEEEATKMYNAGKIVEMSLYVSEAWQQSVEYLKKLAAAHPDSYRVQYNLAMIALQEGNDEVAEKELRRIWAEHPGYGLAAAQLVRLLCDQDRFDAALQVVDAFRPGPRMHVVEYVAWYRAISELNSHLDDPYQAGLFAEESLDRVCAEFNLDN